MYLKESTKWYMEGFVKSKGKGEILLSIYYFKNKRDKYENRIKRFYTRESLQVSGPWVFNLQNVILSKLFWFFMPFIQVYIFSKLTIINVFNNTYYIYIHKWFTYVIFTKFMLWNHTGETLLMEILMLLRDTISVKTH